MNYPKYLLTLYHWGVTIIKLSQNSEDKQQSQKGANLEGKARKEFKLP